VRKSATGSVKLIRSFSFARSLRSARRTCGNQ
jgi:hypothetical protein